ncbi:olfactory receptor 56A1-like [Ambystoma mexicanum]|uniref:olfactory receptor 56A1-like n=1 Tax=Ambystoma mexicanum TaxID=8296 RepID=UPI0037E8BBE3
MGCSLQNFRISIKSFELVFIKLDFRVSFGVEVLEMMLVTPRRLTNNSTGGRVTEFILVGIPGFQRWQHWLSVPLAPLLFVAVMANITLVFTIYREQNLHEPMYYFLFKLALVDLALSLVTTPKILAMFWFDLRSISPAGCFAQMFFVHCLLGSESGVFVAMAFDRYFAICSPLRYTSVLTNVLVGKVMAVITVRSLVCTVPLPLFAARLHYCSDPYVRHSFCANLAVVKLACDDISLSSIYQLAIAWSMLGGDLIMIFLSYCLILHAVLKLRTEGAASKAFSTCISHLILILFFYSTLIVLALTNKSESEIITDMAIVLNVLHLIVPPALNPIVYGVRTKEINHGIRKQFSYRS